MNERIRQIRKALDKTQQEFADSLDTSRNNVAGWETGTRVPSATALALICTRHNVNKEFLIEGKGEMFLERNMENELMAWAGRVLAEKDDSFKKRFIKMLMSLDEDEWEILAKKSMMLAGLDK